MKQSDKIISLMIPMFFMLILSGCPVDSFPPNVFAEDVFPLDNCFIATFSTGRIMSLELIDNNIEPIDATNGRGALDVSGNFAYVASWDHLCIYDISNISNIIRKCIFPINQGRDIKVLGNYAYIAEGEFGLCKIDVTNKNRPVIASTYDTPGYAQNVFLSNDIAYVADWVNGMEIIDVSGEEMTGICVIELEGVTDAAWVLDNTAYILNSYDGLVIYDVSNPYSPVFVSNFQAAQYADEIFIEFPYAYLPGYIYEGIQILDIENSASPHVESVYQMSDGVTKDEYICYNVAVKDGIAYLAGGTKIGLHTHSRVEMVDVSDPAHPVLLGGTVRK